MPIQHLAPAGRFAWEDCYLYVVPTALRLARFTRPLLGWGIFALMPR